MIKRLGSALVVVFIIFMFFACGNVSDPLVARVGNHGITLSEFEANYKQGKALSLIKSATFEDHKEHLHKMVEDRLKLIDAYNRGYDTLEDLQKYINAEMEQSLNSRIIEREIVDKLVSEQEIYDLYRKNNVQVKARHILLKVPSDASKEEEASIYKKAFDLYKRIKKKESFAEIAKQYSDDKITGPNGGYLGTVKWGGVGYDDAFYNEIFRLDVGEISLPVRSDRGFHIIKIDEAQTSFTIPYYEAKPELKRELFSRKQAEAREAYDEFVDKLRWQYRVRIDTTNINLLINKVSLARTNRSNLDGPRDNSRNEFSELTQEERKLTIATYIGGNVTIGDIVSRVESIQRGNRPRMYYKEDAYIWIDGLVNLRVALEEAKRQKLHLAEDFNDNIRSYLERLMLRRINNDMIRNNLSLVEEDYIAYYEGHKEQYMTDPQYQVQEIYVRQKELAEELLARIRAGEDFSRIAGEYTERAAVKGKNGILGYITENQFGDIGKRAVHMKIGEISDIIPMGNKYSIVKLLDKKESRIKTYDEAKILVRRDLRRIEELQIEKQWLNELKEKIDVFVYEDQLKAAFASLFEE